MKQKLIRKIIEEYTFANKKTKSPDFCPCYNGTKCHNVSENELICVFCYCPEYIQNSEIPQGRCGINSNRGFYFHHPNLPKEGIWDCSNCNMPQTRKYVENYLTKLSEEKLKRILETDFKSSRSLFEFIRNVSQE